VRRAQGKGHASKTRADSAEIEFNHYPRIAPGEYHAYCKGGKHYYDPGFKRWTCLLHWEVLSPNLMRLAFVPQWLALGSGEKPRASRRGKYFPEWVRANGGPPSRRDRLSPTVFARRMARVEVGDTEGPAPYSVVRRIIEWESGFPGYPVSTSHNQEEPLVSGVESGAFEGCLSGSPEEGRRDGVKGKPKRFSLPAFSEDFAFRENGKDEHAREVELSISSSASALAGVEGETTHSTHPRGGRAGNSRPARRL